MEGIILFFISLHISYASGIFFGSEPAWNSLKVTWGIGLSYFNYMPRTVKEALDMKYVALPKSKLFCGNRYTKDEDHSVVLIYDNNGYIAGIQSSYSKLVTNKEPFFTKQTPPFVEEDDYLTLTAYFVEPAVVCNEGRSEMDFKNNGTGTVLLIQNDRNPLHHTIRIPLLESNIPQTKFKKGKCFFTMGMHYWYNTDEDMDCLDFKPIFLMYNKGKLNGFGWAVMGTFTNPHFEHPTPKVLSKFFNPVPKCLMKEANLSTMHVFLTKVPYLNFC